MHQVLYRKWRPKTFDDVVGQEHITTTLQNEIAAGKPAHAYLFMGSRGTGKTSCSRIVAKAVNCKNCAAGNPCGICDICAGIDNGSMVDIVELDAASNNGVDNIRDLREEANFLPNITQYRVYIIDEVHMLSTGAFNALLKILEEPPAHVIFILATTEVHKVPATILSRCQRFDFRRIDSAIIAQRLNTVATAEGMSLDPQAALLIARLADGGMRDALSILDLCASHSSQITVDTVSQATGLVGQDYLFAIADAVTQKSVGGFIEAVGKMGQMYVEYDRLCEQLIAHYRNLMLAKGVKEPGDLIVCLPETLEKYKEQASRLKMSQIIHALEILQATFAAMARSTSRKTELELAAIKLCDASVGQNLEDLIERIEQLEATQRLQSAQAAAAPAATARPATSAPKAAPAQATAAVAQQQQQDSLNDDTPTTEDALPFADWASVLSRLGKINAALHGFLAGSHAYVHGSRMLIASKNTMFLNLVRSSDQAKEDLKKAIAQVTGQIYNIGPYNGPDTAPKQGEAPEENPLDSLMQKAKDAGIPVEIE